MKEKIHLFIAILISLFCSNPVLSQSLFVGEVGYLSNPSVSGSLDATAWECLDGKVGVSKTSSGARIVIYQYFEGTSTIQCQYNYTYYVGSTKYYMTNQYAYYYISCKPSTITLSDKEIEIEPGDFYELTCTNSSGFDLPEIEWTTSDKNVALLHEDYIDAETKKGVMGLYVKGVAVGTCTLTCNGKNGSGPQTCIIHVVDDRPHLTADVESGVVTKGTKVTLTCDVTGADIRYTTDGSTPNRNSTKCTSPIVLTESIELSAKAYAEGKESKTLYRTYTVVAHADGEVFKAKTVEGVEMTFEAKGASLQVGKSDGSITAISKTYTGHVTIPKEVDGMRIVYIASKAFSGCQLSSLSFSINNMKILPNAFQNCTNLKSFTIPCPSYLGNEVFIGCTSLKEIVFEHTGLIYFCKEGQSPIQNGEKTFWNCNNIKDIYIHANEQFKMGINNNNFTTDVYNNAILHVTAGKGLVNYFRKLDGWKNFKNIVEIGQEKEKLLLTASPSGGQVSAGTTVTLTAKAEGTTVSGCDIYYTTNGQEPSKNNGTKYTSSGIPINSACTLKAIAYKSGYEDSEVLTETYTIKEDTKPKLVLSASPSSGEVSAGTTVTLTAKADGSTVSGCDIYYTLDGKEPSKSNGTKYSSGITVNSACTLKAIAYKSGYEDSDVLTTTYTIKEDTKPKLVLSASPSGGQVSAGTKVTLTAKANGSTVSGCDIYYTTDGTTPSRNNGKEYSSGITINSACTLKAIAYKSGYEDSDVLTASFTTRNGNTFDALTIEGVLVTYYIISEKDKTCQVGGNWIHAIPESTTGKLTIPSSVNGYSVIKIAERAFAMSKIESIFIPKTITDIRYNGQPFLGCAKLANITVEAGNNYYDSRQGCNAIIETSTNKLIVGGKNTTIPNTVVAIGYDAFGSREIRDITIPNSVKIIEATAFSSSTLQSITIPNSVTKIGNNAFGYTRLSAIAIPASVKEIESNLFVGCTYLNKIVVDANNSVYDSRNDCNAIIETASNTLICGCKSSVIPSTIVNIRSSAFLNQQISVITIPNSVKTIGESAFVGCWPKTIISKIEAPFKIEEKVFYYSLFSSHNPYNVSTLIVPSGTKSLYETTEGWNKFKKIVESCKIVLTASPSGGEVQKGTIVRLTANVDDAEIYYALGDNDSYHKYSSENGILISESVKLYASAHKDGFEDSDVLAIDYKVKEKIILSATPSGGNVENGTKVYLKTQNTTDCDIYYTLDGTKPSKSSTKYTSAGIAINEDCTLKAIAYKDGYETSDILTETYTIKKEDIRLAITSSGYATFYSSMSAYTLPNGLSAKVVKEAGNGKLTYETIVIIDGSNVNVVPKGVPVMIESNNKRAGTYTLTTTASGATYTGANLLHGSDEATTTTGDGLHYKLSYGPSGTSWRDVFGWYWGSQNGAPFQMEGHKAWLVVPRENGTRAAGFSIDGDALGIGNVNLNDNLNDDFYDLQGRRVSQPTRKGLYIRNGRKIVK